jgi:hypothetical protein
LQISQNAVRVVFGENLSALSRDIEMAVKHHRLGLRIPKCEKLNPLRLMFHSIEEFEVKFRIQAEISN